MSANALLKESHKGLALIVDDELANRVLLQRFLAQEGFETIPAEDGEQAVDAFREYQPDIVFMDVMMEGMGGMEATRVIKTMSGDRFVPVLFLTALNDTESLESCIAAGGDDFITKPINLRVLKSRILALERVRDVHRALRAKHDELALRYDAERREEEIAERVFAHAISARNESFRGIEVLHRPAASFSGDLVLVGRMPSGAVRILLGDFTGHGLAAAIGILPLSEIFHSMTQAGASCAELLNEINRKLCFLLPPDRFLAAALLTIDASAETVTIWNGGMPPVFTTGRNGVRQYPSCALPLGIVENEVMESQFNCIDACEIERVMLMSDGLLEARNPSGSYFLDCELGSLLDRWAPEDSALAAIGERLGVHVPGGKYEDDVTVVEIVPRQVPVGRPAQNAVRKRFAPMSGQAGWGWSLTLSGKYLEARETLQTFLESPLVRGALGQRLGALCTIVGELCSNAVDHGALGLSSTVKDEVDGFDRYYRRRAERIAGGDGGTIDVAVRFTPLADGGEIQVTVSDSGRGFDLQEVEECLANPPANRFWGRGLKVVRELCESVEFSPQGNRVLAVYRWHETSRDH